MNIRELIIETERLEAKNIELRARLQEAESALMSMVEQYTYDPKTEDDDNPTYSHCFMSAGEEAFDYLVKHGIARWIDKSTIIFVTDNPKHDTDSYLDDIGRTQMGYNHDRL